MSWDAILCDFDETLAATSHLKGLRDSAWRRKDDGLWAEYFDKVRFANPVKASDGGVIAEELIALSDAGKLVAVVTASPAESVRAWFKHQYHRSPSVVVGYGDASAPKPSPQPLSRALFRLGVPAGPTVLSVGDEAKDVLAAHRAGVVSATFHRAVPLSAAADIYLPTARSLSDSGTPGAGLPPREAPAALVATDLIGFDRTAVTNGHVLVGGRYVTGGGGLHDAILTAKDGRWSPVLIDAACHLVRQAVGDATNALVTTVPSRGDDPDRFQRLRSEVSSRVGVTEDGTVLEWTKAVGRLKNMKARERREAMANAFEARDVRGRRVVILDDVRTTGSTLAAAARAVRAAGGHPVVVALVQTLSTVIDLPARRDASYEYPMVGTALYEIRQEEEHHRQEEVQRQREERRRRREEARWQAEANRQRRADEERERRARELQQREAREAERQHRAAEERKRREDERQREELERRRKAEIKLQQDKAERQKQLAIRERILAHLPRIQAAIEQLPTMPSQAVMIGGHQTWQRNNKLVYGRVTVPVSNLERALAVWICLGQPPSPHQIPLGNPDQREAALAVGQYLDL